MKLIPALNRHWLSGISSASEARAGSSLEARRPVSIPAAACTVLLVFMLWACGGGADGPVSEDEDRDAVLAVVLENLRALNEEDIEAVMETIDPSAPGFARTRQALEVSFERYNLNYRLEEMELVGITGEEAVVTFVQTTTRLAGPAFRDNRISGLHILHFVDGRWFLHDTFADEIEYLDPPDGT